MAKLMRVESSELPGNYSCASPTQAGLSADLSHKVSPMTELCAPFQLVFLSSHHPLLHDRNHTRKTRLIAQEAETPL